MRFTLLAACLMVGASVATAQQPAQKPTAKSKFMFNMNASVGGSDDCNSATPIAGAGSFNFDNSAATTGAEGQNESICYDFGSSAVENDVWFSYTAAATGSAIINTCNTTSTDTKIGAYPGGGCPTAGSAIACNDDTCGLQSQVTLSVTAGTSYMIQVGTFPGSVGGTGTLNITEGGGGGGGGGGNDDCASPDAISGEGTFAFDSSFATTGTDGQNEYLCYDFGSSAVDNDVWFAWTAASTANHVIGTCGLTSVDTKVGVYPGSGCPSIGSVIACNDDNCGLQSSVIVAATSGSTYMVQVGCFPGAPGGSGSFSIAATVAAGNDDCASSTAIAGQGNFTYDSTTATTGAEGQNESICYDFGSSAVDNDVWFDWTSDITGNVEMTTCNLVSMDTKLAAYAGGGCPTGPALACNDDGVGCASFTSVINFAVVTGSVYTLQCGNFPGAPGGPGNFTMQAVAPPTPHPNDECAGAAAIAGDGNFAFDTSGGTTSDPATTGTDGQGEALCYAFGTSAVNNDIWLSWTANATGLCDVSLCSGATSYDSKMAAWPAACPPVPGTILACNDDTCGLQSELQFNVVSGTTYLLQVGAFSAAGFGPGDLGISTAGAPGGPCTVYCSGDGTGSVACPCSNNGASGEGCQNGSGAGGTLRCTGDASVGADTLVLESTQLLPNQPCLFFQGNNAINSGDGIQFGDGLRCAGGSVIRLQVRFPDASGNAQTSLSVSVKGGCAAGDTKRYQNWFRDPALSPCGALFNLTNGVELTWNP